MLLEWYPSQSVKHHAYATLPSVIMVDKGYSSPLNGINFINEIFHALTRLQLTEVAGKFSQILLTFETNKRDGQNI